MDYIRKHLSSLLLVVIGLVLVTLLPLGGRFGFPSDLEGKVSPELSLASLQTGETVNLAQHKGQDVVVLDFFATWCPPCRKGLPTLHEIAHEFEGENVVFYTVNQKEDATTVSSYWEAEGFTLPVLMDVDGASGSAFDAGTIPTTVVVAPNGTVVLHQVGIGGEADERLRAAIRAAQGMTGPVVEESPPMEEARLR